MPSSSPVKQATGKAFINKAAAVTSACLDAVQLLHQVATLLSNICILPTPTLCVNTTLLLGRCCPNKLIYTDGRIQTILGYDICLCAVKIKPLLSSVCLISQKQGSSVGSRCNQQIAYHHHICLPKPKMLTISQHHVQRDILYFK